MGTNHCGYKKVNKSMDKDFLEALQSVIDYSMSKERKSLLEFLYGEVEIVDFENMPDADLYNYCQNSNINHVWCSFYILSTFKLVKEIDR